MYIYIYIYTPPIMESYTETAFTMTCLLGLHRETAGESLEGFEFRLRNLRIGVKEFRD